MSTDGHHRVTHHHETSGVTAFTARAPNERPILFRGDMVRALLAGTKTQTRRIVKPQDAVDAADDGQVIHLHGKRCGGFCDFACSELPCPYGVPGDRLWVKESYWGCDLPDHGDTPCVVYDEEHFGKDYKPAAPRPWALKFGRIPSIHCSRAVSRITLEITEVRVQRLHGVNDEDARAEGVTTDGRHGESYFPGMEHVVAYGHLWDQINGAGSWDANPWVWALTFKRWENDR